MVAYGNDRRRAPARDSPGALLREVGRLHVRAQREQVACCGGTAAQCHVLTELDRAGPLPVTELARRLGLHKGWISRTVAALADGGLVERSGREGDGRVVVLSLTAGGRRRVAALNAALDHQAAKVLDRIAPAERELVGRALALVRAALREELGAARDGAACARRAREERT